MRKLVASMITLFSVLTIISVPIGASAETLDSNVTSLKADKASQKVFDRVLISHDEEKVTVSGTRKADGTPEFYNITIDKEKGTYKAEKRDDLATNLSSNQSKTSTSSVAASDYQFHVRAHTFDPVDIDCNWSELGQGWHEDSGTFSLNWRTKTYWDAAPTTLGTYWYFVSDSWGNDPLYFNSMTGRHVNYNFLGGVLGTTYANLYIYVSPRPNGNVYYDASLTTSGVNGNLLHIAVGTY